MGATVGRSDDSRGCGIESAAVTTRDRSSRTGSVSGWRLLRAVLRDQRMGLATGVLAGVLWSSGKVDFSQMATTHHSDRWGDAIMAASVAELVGA